MATNAIDVPEELQRAPDYQMVKVLNKNSFAITDRFDGVPFTFLPNQPISIPPDAAQHFFGWPAEPFERNQYIAKRLGWNTPDDIKRDETGRQRWEVWTDNILLSTVTYDLVPREAGAQTPALEGLAADPTLDYPLPMAPQPDPNETKVGIGRHAGRKAGPRRVNV